MENQDDKPDLQFIYVTTTGRKTGLPREIEIWFVEHDSKFFLFAEHFFKANWVRNIQKNPRVRARLGDRSFAGLARILDEQEDAELWRLTQQLARQKYGWGEGLPVEITVVESL